MGRPQFGHKANRNDGRGVMQGGQKPDKSGKIGHVIGRLIGSKLGGFAGKHLGKYTGIGEKGGEDIGGRIGGKLGSFVPFKKGGRVKRTEKAVVHKGEYVLPRGVKPTKKQRKAVKKRHRRKRKMC